MSWIVHSLEELIHTASFGNEIISM